MTRLGMITAVAIALLPQAMRAQVDPLTLDDFSTGAGKASATSGTKTVTMTGSGIYGGTRAVSVVFGKGSKANAFGQPAQAQVRPEATGGATPSALVVSEGYDVDAVIQVAYEGAANESLNLDMAPYNRFRVTYAGVTQQLDFVFEVIDNSGNYSEVGCDVGPYAPSLSASGFTTVDIPTASFGPTLSGPVNWNKVESILLQWESANSYGVDNFAVTGLSALTPADTSAPTVVCPPAS